MTLVLLLLQPSVLQSLISMSTGGLCARLLSGRINVGRRCAIGCHGIGGQGLVGPNLQGVSTRLSDPQIIQQVVSGKTPPMPRFEIEPQEMADLLAHLHGFSGAE